ncbi:Growth_factor receptor cysteine-rich domain superfamily [Hexamita inflata]|uniref:Growth factor receptor cysteine-rich domain superfamily n=1 Tax=Hexamita inflata TaxID=28002 RepID=A0AA86TPZ6_9EUKA|nr:Growth factor receptor cysteine-rich domain superfamily [Hexamita inflata]
MIVAITALNIQCQTGFPYNGTCSQCDTSKYFQPNKVNGYCVCQETFYQYGNQCAQCDPTYFKPAMENDWCVCSGKGTSQFLNYWGNLCTLCDEVHGQQQMNGSCKCSVGYEITNTEPLVCSKCDKNSVFVNGSCQCNNGYIKVGNTCSKQKSTQSIVSGVFISAFVTVCVLLGFIIYKLKNKLEETKLEVEKMQKLINKQKQQQSKDKRNKVQQEVERKDVVMKDDKEVKKVNPQINQIKAKLNNLSREITQTIANSVSKTFRLKDATQIL